MKKLNLSYSIVELVEELGVGAFEELGIWVNLCWVKFVFIVIFFSWHKAAAKHRTNSPTASPQEACSKKSAVFSYSHNLTLRLEIGCLNHHPYYFGLVLLNLRTNILLVLKLK